MAKKTKTPRAQRIRTRTQTGKVQVGGWLSGRNTYLRFQAPDGGLDFIDGQRLYRLAKAIVARFEAAK